MKIIIAGSRGVTEFRRIEEAVAMSEFEIDEVVSGTARGVDQLGEKYAASRRIPVKQFPADWKNIDVPGAVIKENRYGKYNAAAGHQRNAQMGEYVDALIAIWDGKSRGTLNMIEFMKVRDKPVFIYRTDIIP